MAAATTVFIWLYVDAVRRVSLEEAPESAEDADAAAPAPGGLSGLSGLGLPLLGLGLLTAALGLLRAPLTDAAGHSGLHSTPHPAALRF